MIRRLLLLAPALLSGCASLSTDECRQGDWYGIGRHDGAAGYPASQFEHHRKACAEIGVLPQWSPYAAGRDEGLTTYCTPFNGYAVGRRGEAYRYVCPKTLEDDFLSRHRVGLEIYRASQEVRRLEGQIAHQRRELEKADDRRQREVRERIRHLERERDAARRQLRILEAAARW